MKLSIRNADRGTLTDASGQPIPYCIEADTETGVCLVYASTMGGYILNESGELVRETVTHAAPLQWSKRDEWTKWQPMRAPRQGTF
jgi:hypothetical protein